MLWSVIFLRRLNYLEKPMHHLKNVQKGVKLLHEVLVKLHEPRHHTNPFISQVKSLLNILGVRIEKQRIHYLSFHLEVLIRQSILICLV